MDSQAGHPERETERQPAQEGKIAECQDKGKRNTPAGHSKNTRQASAATPLARGLLPREQNGTRNKEGRAPAQLHQPVCASCNGQAQHGSQPRRRALRRTRYKGAQCHARAHGGIEAKHSATSWRGTTKCVDKQ